jgi:hypothetical protein
MSAEIKTRNQREKKGIRKAKVRIERRKYERVE